MTSNECNLCKEIAYQGTSEQGGGYESIVASRRNLIAETANFAILPSIGPLNSSHAMIVPKEHFNCIAALPKPSISEAVSIINKLKNFYQTRYGKKLIFFESGAGSLTDHSGGCIVHAHIHVLTESLAFDKRIREEVKLELSSKQDHSSADKEFGYVWYMNGEGKQYLSNRPLLPSQFLRYLYSSCENISQQWNWRRHPNINGVEEVLVTYADFKAC